MLSKVLVTIIIAGFLAAGVIFVIGIQKTPQKAPAPQATNETVAQPTDEEGDREDEQQNLSELWEDQKEDYLLLAEKLENCTPYKDSFVHPFNGETMQREITGLTSGKCHYTEEMPNNGLMECNYLESERMVVSQYYEDIASAESISTNISIDFDPEDTKIENTYTINGKTVSNPLQEALISETCVISGY